MKRVALVVGGIAVGLALGFLVGWVLWPVNYYDTPPTALHPTYKQEYVELTALAYAVDGDLDAARLRLSRLNPAAPAVPLLLLTERLIDEGVPENEILPLARLARDLGQATPAMAPYLEEGS